MLLPHTSVPGVELRVSRVLGPEELHRVLGGPEGLPSVEVLSQLLPERAEDHAAQFTVELTDSGTTVGVVGLHTLDLTNGHVRAEIHMTPAAGPSAVAWTAALTVNYAFSMFPVRKLYLWTVDEEARVYQDLPVKAHREGALLEYVVDGANHRDLTVFTIGREDWQAASGYLDGLVQGATDRRETS